MLERTFHYLFSVCERQENMKIKSLTLMFLNKIFLEVDGRYGMVWYVLKMNFYVVVRMVPYINEF